MEELKQIAALAGPGNSELHWKDGKKAYYPKDGAITDEVIRAHLDGSQPIGINMNVGDDKTHLAVFDLDDHDGAHQDTVVQMRVGFIAAALQQLVIPYFVARSGSGRGYHVWIAFANAARMDVVRGRMRDVLATANRILANSPWGSTEKFVADDGQGKGMFHDTGKVVQRHRERDFTLIEHHVELLPKGGKRPVVALLLALKSVLMTPTVIDGNGAMQFAEGGDLVVTKAQPRKSGPKSEQRAREVDEAAALRAFMKVRPGGGYKGWMDAGFNIFGAFGDDGFDHWLTYSKETDVFETERAVRDKWDEISKTGKCGREPFWTYARQGGYTGGLPDGVNLTRKGDAKSAVSQHLAMQPS